MNRREIRGLEDISGGLEDRTGGLGDISGGLNIDQEDKRLDGRLK